ncbi:hypothetical protein [Agaribacter flavus]|uniref:NOMO second beta-sandwich domain-containing protein n=1 Tax=Agaribacter flavus TaxID=1902781 RepID=A0ABV7FPK4_9ALTE
MYSNNLVKLLTFLKISVFICLSSFFLLSEISAQEAGATLPESSEEEFLLAGRFEVGEVLFFDVRVAKYRFGFVPAVVTENGLAFDFEVYLSSLNLPINIENETKAYSGWFIETSNTFFHDSLSANNTDIFVVAGEKFEFPTSHSFYLDDTYYVGEQVLSEAMGFSHEYDFDSLILTLTSKKALPFLQKLARQKRGIASLGSRDSQYVNLPRSYELLSPQILDTKISVLHRKDSDQTRANYSIIGSRDIALVNSNIYIAGNQDDTVSDVRATFTRQSLEANLLGPLNARSVEFGDIRPVRQATTRSNGESRGIRVTNAEELSSIQNEVTNIQGDVQDGWDVELYRNGVLIGQEFNVSGGRYNFLDIPLVFGVNNFEVILYGSEGQIVTRNFSKIVDKNSFSNSAFTYDVSLNQNNESLFGVREFSQEFENDFNLSAQFRKGISSGTQLSAGFQYDIGDETGLGSANVGVNATLTDEVLASAYLIKNSDSTSISSNVRTFALGHAISLDVSRTQFETDGLSAQSKFGLQTVGNVKLTKSLRLPIQNRLSYEKRDKLSEYQFSNSVGLNMRWISLFNNITFNQVEDEFNNKTVTNIGALTAQTTLNKFHVRLGYNYDIENKFTPVSYLAAVNWAISNSLRARLNYNHVVDEELDRADFLLSYINPKWDLNTSIQWSELVGWTFGLSARFSITGMDVSYDNNYQDRLPLTKRGSIAVRVFVDENLNAVYDKGEPIVSGAKVRAVQARRVAKTDDNGIAVLSSIPNQVKSDIVIDRDSLPDPFLAPMVPGVSIEFRSGLVDKLDYPLAESSELEGLISIVDGDRVKDARNVRVELSRHGRIVDSVTTEIDGFYLFKDVLPGKYKISINEDSLNTLDIAEAPSISVTVGKQSDILSGNNLSLKKRRYVKQLALSLGQFNSEKMMNVYAELIIARANIHVFKQFTSDGKYRLLSGNYSSDQEKVASIDCLKLANLNIPCEIAEIDVPVGNSAN